MGETRHSSHFSSNMVVVFVPQSFMRRCSRSFHRSRQQVVHTMKANICVLSKLTWCLCKRMHLHFSSQHFHITRLHLVI